MVAAAGEMATEAGITGWPAGEAIDAARRCFNAWIEARPGGIGMSEDAQMLRQMRGWFGLHGEARFTRLEPRRRRPRAEDHEPRRLAQADQDDDRA